MTLYDTIFRPLFRAVAAAFRTPARRISFAIAFSAMIHAAILWLPHIQLSHDKVQLPPLTARLEPLPKPVAEPAAKPEPANHASQPDGSASTKPVIDTEDTMKEMEKSAEVRLFPKHVQLTFIVYRGADFFRIGELRHQLDIHKDKYTLKATKQTAGLTSLLNNDRLIQSSRGKIGEQGLQPETFKEEKITDGGRQSSKITFDRVTQKLRFSHGGNTDFPADAQDVLSFMYQLSQLPMDREIIPLPISDGAYLKEYEIEIGGKEDIEAPMGKLHALHLRKLHIQGEAYFEIWLGLEYRLLPVKFRQVDGSGEVTEEFVISDIRATDE
ncbi:MAG: DUF3108 domain-containing protein [Gallionella sp.]|nr:DUF3108 domain-containing protein [Gallionella sp.]